MQLKKPYLAFILFILVNIGQAFAQSTEVPEAAKTKEVAYRIGLGLGYSFLGYREETDLPINRTMDTVNFNMNGNIEYNNIYYTFNFGLLKGEIDPFEIESNEEYFTYYQKKINFLRIYIENAIDAKMWGSSVFPGYFGGALRIDCYFSDMKESYYNSITMISSLNLHMTQKWIINKGKELAFSASIPFFGYASRPPYYGLSYAPNESEERVTSFHNYRAIFGDLNYHQKIDESFSFYLSLGFKWSHITFPQPRKDAEFCMNAGIAFTF